MTTSTANRLAVLASAILACCLATAPDRAAGQERGQGLLYTEGFEDDAWKARGWNDMTAIRLAGGASAGRSCIEYEWVDREQGTQGSSPARRLFAATDRVYLRFDLKLSAGWGWSGRNYHPH